MKKNVFLTGKIQVGKSTIINKYMAASGLQAGGFKTLGANYKPDGSSGVYIFSAAEKPRFTKENCLFTRFEPNTGKKIEIYTHVFDTLGPKYLYRKRLER